MTVSGWAWWLLAVLVAAGAAWMHRYEPVILREEDTQGQIREVRWVWDRWRARWCTFGYCINLAGKASGELMHDPGEPPLLPGQR